MPSQIHIRVSDIAVDLERIALPRVDDNHRTGAVQDSVAILSEAMFPDWLPLIHLQFRWKAPSNVCDLLVEAPM